MKKNCFSPAPSPALSVTAANAEIKVGVLHSTTGTMAISETTLRDVMLMLIEQQNAAGGLLGQELVPVVVDGASDWPTFAERTRELLTVDEVDVIFCCWTSTSRKAILPVVEELGGIVFYPVQYEGEESSLNVFYTGAAPNQQAIPAVDYFIEELGVESFALLGTDYVYPRTTNRILRAVTFWTRESRRKTSSSTTRPSAHSDWSSIVSDVVALGATGEQVGGDLHDQRRRQRGLLQRADRARRDGRRHPPSSPSPSARRSFRASIPSRSWGTSRRGTTFMSADTPENEAFIAAWHEFTGDDTRVTNDPMEAHYIGFQMWVAAVEAAGTTEPDAVRAAMYGLQVPNLTGGMAEMLPNHHLTKPVLIGEIRADGQFRHRQPDRPRPRRRMDRFPRGLRRARLGLARPRLRHVQHRDRDLRAASVQLLTKT